MDRVKRYLDLDKETHFSTDVELYPRTNHDFTLDEICYIMDKILEQHTIEDIALLVKRSPTLLQYKFL